MLEGQILDVESLKKLGEQNDICPYYKTHQIKSTNDVVLCPYAYLLEEKSRDKMFNYLNIGLAEKIA
jgi:Zn-finger protein